MIRVVENIVLVCCDYLVDCDGLSYTFTCSWLPCREVRSLEQMRRTGMVTPLSSPWQ